MEVIVYIVSALVAANIAWLWLYSDLSHEPIVRAVVAFGIGAIWPIFTLVYLATLPARLWENR